MGQASWPHPSTPASSGRKPSSSATPLVCHPPPVMRRWAGCCGSEAWRPQHGALSTCCSAVAVASVPQRAVVGVIRELEAGAAVGLQARRRTLALRRLRVVPVVAPADALSEVREVARRTEWLKFAEARERGRPLGGGQRAAGERLAAGVPIVLDRAPSVSAARCRRRAHAWSGVLAARLAQVVCGGAGKSDPWFTPPRFGWPAVVALKGNSRSTKARPTRCVRYYRRENLDQKHNGRGACCCVVLRRSSALVSQQLLPQHRT